MKTMSIAERYRRIRRDKKRRGECYACKQPAVPGRSRCALHLQLVRECVSHIRRHGRKSAA